MEIQAVPDKVITIEPSRNLLSFNKFDEINHLIINEQLEILIAMLKLIVPLELIDDGKTTFEIRRNYLNYSMRVNTKNKILIARLLKSFLDAENCCYLEINGRIYRNGVYRDILSLEYDPRSFRQPDDSIRDYIIHWFQQTLPRGWDSIIFFGGECVLLGKILSGYSKLQYFYTDFPSIYDDIIRNYKNPNVELINYKDWQVDKNKLNKLNKLDKDMSDNINPKLQCCIVNTGYKGMGDNLAREIIKISARDIYVISCNLESWDKDLRILKEFYDFIEQIEIRTNYSIWINKLSRNSIM